MCAENQENIDSRPKILPTDDYMMAGRESGRDFAKTSMDFLTYGLEDRDIDKTRDFLQTFFDSCRKNDENRENEIVKLKNMIQKFGGINSLSGNWEDLAAETLILGADSMFTINVALSQTVAGKYILTFSPFEILEKNSGHYENPIFAEAFKKYIGGLMKLLDLEMSKDDVRDIFEFERRLANITRNGMIGGKLTTLGEFKTNQTQINWTKILKKVSVDKLPDHQTQINLTNPYYFEMLNCKIKEVKPATIKNAIIWRLITTFSQVLPSKFEEPLNELRKTMKSNAKFENRNEFCYKQVTTHLPMVSASDFIPTYISDESRSNISEIYNNLKTVLKSRIQKSSWMDQETQKKALHKLETMKLRIGFPESLLDKEKTLRPYEKLKLSNNSFLENVWQVRKVNYELEILKLTEKSDDFIDWPTVVHSVNAYYHLHTNQVVLAVSMLRNPLFNADLPKFFQYGALGAFIAHEITHGFDTQGASFDEFGNLKNWWKPATYQKFVEKSQCFIDQANSTVEPRTTKNFDGLQTLGENIADSGGVQIAFEAFMAKMRESGEKKLKLEGYEGFSDEKMFFMSYAHASCDHMESHKVSKRLKTDQHLFGEARLNNALKNFPKFAKVFGCKPENQMVLEKEEVCEIW
ncbi:unnamed protein product [Caenorhabditis angaria]|uniref:Peptidase M13 C-terminal domain-containing protein n=1 Tax=Caenorhabditis angaria TaxID=860376 RepID=A0A9P1IE97_9PELO|nr:unnamed protein product [Caenorhabditis angaria]